MEKQIPLITTVAFITLERKGNDRRKAVRTIFLIVTSIKMILCNQTFAYIDRKLGSGKDKHRKEIFSQSCISLSGNSTYTATTASTTSSSSSLYSPPELSSTEEICKITTEDSCHKDKINLFTSNSICTTISAISNLNRSVNVKGHCLSCSLDGLKKLHPQCCGKEDGKKDIKTIENIRYRTGNPATVSQKNDNILNISLRSSITFSSTWPKRGGKIESVKLSRSASSHSLPIHDQGHGNNHDSKSESNDSSLSTKLESVGKHSSKRQISTSLDNEHRNLFEEFSDPHLGAIINTSDLCDDLSDDNGDDDNNDDSEDNGDNDDLCDDWDDSHSTQEEVDDLEMKIMEDQEIEREDIEVDLYNHSDHGSDQLNTKHNAVMDDCDWSFMDENDKRKKRILKKEKGLESDSVSSCSLSGDEESDDDGSIDQYLMKKISNKKNQENRNRPISTGSGKNSGHNGPILTGTAKSRGPILTGTKNNFHATSETGCLSTASTINIIQHY